MKNDYIDIMTASQEEIRKKVDDYNDSKKYAKLTESSSEILNISSKFQSDSEIKKTSQKMESIKNKQLSNDNKLLFLNQQILQTLKKIEANMVDEQDTSIKKFQRNEKTKSILNAELTSGNTLSSTGEASNSFGASDLLETLGGAYLLNKARKKNKDGRNKTKIKKNKSIKNVSKNVSKIVKNARKGSGKLVSKLGLRSLAGASKAIPIAGQFIAAGMALYDGFQGWNNASENLGIDKDKLSTTNKVASSLGSIASGLTFGLLDEKTSSKYVNEKLGSIVNGFTNQSENLGIDKKDLTLQNKVASGLGSAVSYLTMGLADAKDLGQGFNNISGGNPYIKRFEKAGIIDHNLIGKSEIKDWDKLRTLSPEDIQKIININDWTNEDLERLKQIKDTPKETDSGIKKISKKLRTDAIREKELGKKNTIEDLSKITFNSASNEIANLSESDIRKLIETTTDEKLRVRLSWFSKERDTIDEEFRSRGAQDDQQRRFELESIANNYFKLAKENVDDEFKFKKNYDAGFYALSLSKEQVFKEVNKKKISSQIKTPPISTYAAMSGTYQTPTSTYASSYGALASSNSSTFFGAGSVFEPFTLKPSDSKFNLDSRIGILSEKYEVGKGGVGTISSGKGDPGGKSYGTWQLSSNAGTLGAFVKYSNGEIGEQLRKYPLTSPDFDRAWKSIANQDPKGFEKQQYDFLYNANYVPVLNHANSLGIDTSSKAIQNVLWSQAIQHGLAGNKTILNDAVKSVGKNAEPQTLINAIYNARSSYVSKLDMEAGTKQSLLNRYKNEGADALAMLQNESKTTPESNKLGNNSNILLASSNFTQPESNKSEANIRIDNTNNNIKTNSQPINNINVINNRIMSSKKEVETVTEDYTKEEDLSNAFAIQGDDF